MSETESAYLIQAELRVQEGRCASRSGRDPHDSRERRQQKEDKARRSIAWRVHGAFVRRFTMPDNADDTRVEAQFKDGMLSVNVSKSAQQKPKARQIAIS